MCQPSDAGLTSIILKIEAPCSVADVKKPAVISGQRTMPGSRSTRSACDSTMPTTLWSLSRSSSLPPLRIERKSGPVGISPASSYTCKASTGHAIKPRTIPIVAPTAPPSHPASREACNPAVSHPRQQSLPGLRPRSSPCLACPFTSATTLAWS